MPKHLGAGWWMVAGLGCLHWAQKGTQSASDLKSIQLQITETGDKPESSSPSSSLSHASLIASTYAMLCI